LQSHIEQAIIELFIFMHMQRSQQIPQTNRSHSNFSEGWQVGGDAYTAVVVAKKTGTGSWLVYNIFRDHLGTITHLKNGSTIDEYSFDAWGRRRDKDNWSYTLSGEPALFADRGLTGSVNGKQGDIHYIKAHSRNPLLVVVLFYLACVVQPRLRSFLNHQQTLLLLSKAFSPSYNRGYLPIP
jgi:hypothetical protein